MSISFIVLLFSNLCIFPYYYNTLFESRITHLPGFNGSLPFYLETGYVTVNEESGAELFYYFVESERNPSDDPLILWLVGGPYCSGFEGLALDIGPLMFKVKAYDGTLPTLVSNPYAWTKISSIIFLDWPVGTGFSFSRSMVDYHTDEVQSRKQIYKFLVKWLLDHPSFQSNPFYVGGDSYGGKMAPMLVLEIADGNEDFQRLFINLKGYFVGNPVTDDRIDISSQAPYAHGLGIISDELYKMILINCAGEDYLNPKSALCAANLKTFNEFLSEINRYSILEPKCDDDSPQNELEGDKRSIKEISLEFYCSISVPDIDCANDRLLSYYWSNDNLTKEALHIKEGTVDEWHRCKQFLNNYTFNIPSSVPHHLNATSRGYRALVYSGDHDLDVPFISTLEWIRSFNFSIVDNWRSWRAGGQVAGYTMLFSNNLTFATVKGGSHTAPDNMPLQCFVMFERLNGMAVVALLRHFGCICCWELASELKDLIPRFDAAGVKLIAVGVGTPDNAHILAERLPFPLDYLYADPDRKAYDALGLYHGLGRTFFNPASAKVFSRFSSLRKAATNYTISATPDDKSSVLQQGGMLVFKGKELLYARKDEGTGDHAPLEDVLNICCKVSVS